MSFYGSRYEEIAKTFATFFIRNGGRENTAAGSPIANSFQIDSDGKHGEMTFDSGNRWISLSGQISPDNRCFIRHNGPNKNSDTSKIILSAKSEIEEDGKMVWKEIKEDDETILDLTKNNELKIQAIGYDEAGHLYFKSDDTKIFKIPKVEVAKTLEEIQARLKNAEDNISVLNEETEKIEGIMAEAETQKVHISELERFCGDMSELSTYKDISLSNAIGDISSLRNSLKLGDISLSEIAANLEVRVSSAEGSVSYFGDNLKEIVARVTALEDKIK